ncbi:type IV secretory system conjugative DNA transfer family protein [Aliarcobacter cryaerophilus]|uniref:type IV secretory system conjugative DNA transfer family protein n=1 Tax=Aliarcobacter cryaerophilus TaxID=28198 RepID=UPI0021B4B320|nr:TraM recognition domain-containing protein [Aliarcobacter cryaerophilus]MCT7508607.1 type IV secretion system DNA-binding domain-containing protein [Aliarcobacter cryaerophilus]
MNYPYQYYPPYPYTQQPYQNNLYSKQQIDYEIEKRLRQAIQYDSLREYDEIVSEARGLLNSIIINPNNSLKKDANNIYLNCNNKVLINPLENIDEIEKELSTTFSKEVKIVKDTKDIVEKRRDNPQIIYLPLFLIPNKIEPIWIFDVYDNVKNGDYHFNFFTYTPYLTKRFKEKNDSNITFNEWCEFFINKVDIYDKHNDNYDNNDKYEHQNFLNTYFIKYFLYTFTINTNSEYIEEWLTHFFKTLRRRREALVLVGNRDVSEEMFYNAIIKQIFGFDYCSTIDDWMLENLTVAQIVENKLFIHINYIPEDKNHQKKLKDLLESVIVYDFSKQYPQNTYYLCQIIFTLDAPHPFLSDFLSSSKVFFIDSMENVNKKLNQPDRISLLNNITKNLDEFSEQLAALDLSQVKQYGNGYKFIDFNPQEVINQRVINFSNKIVLNDTVDFKEKDYKTDNELCKNWIKNPELMQFALSNNKDKPILDPFHESFETILPKEDRYKHTYVTGITGSGKSELLKTLIYADIQRDDSSVILLDIHGDLAQSVAKLVEDKDRLLLIDPTLHKDKTPTINLFDIQDKSDENIAQVTQMISSVIKSVSSEDKFSGTMMDFLENCISVLLRKGDSDIFELKQFMNSAKTKNVKNNIVLEYDAKTQKLINLAKDSDDPFESEYFNNEFDNVKSETKNAIKRRLNKMLKDTIFSNLVNGKSKINLEKEINTKGKVIIFKIPKAKMLNTYTHYIRFIIGFIQIVALKRADIEQENARPKTHLYIDEFHNFITPTIEEIIAESRKYKLFLTLSHQSISQIKETNLREIILENTHVKIIGKNSNKTLETMNKTINEKVDNVEMLKAGEFYIKSGQNELIKIQNTNKLLDGKEDISNEQIEEQKEYQLETYYRKIVKPKTAIELEKELDESIDKFITAIKKLDTDYFTILLESDDEFKENFSDKTDGADGYIAQPKLADYFTTIYPELDNITNAELLKKLKSKDPFFEQAPDDSSKRFGQKRYKIVLNNG